MDIAPLQRILNIDTITSAGQHLLAIINDILDLSKIEADKTRVEHIETPLIELLSEVERLLRPRASGKGVLLNAKLSSPVPDRILCDPTRLRQILMNLVGNAVKFTEEGSISINASVEGASENASLIIDIEDTGPGMTSEQSQSLFRAFEQADSTVTRKHGGTGLGLTISRKVSPTDGRRCEALQNDFWQGILFPIDFADDSRCRCSHEESNGSEGCCCNGGSPRRRLPSKGAYCWPKTDQTINACSLLF